MFSGAIGPKKVPGCWANRDKTLAFFPIELTPQSSAGSHCALGWLTSQNLTLFAPIRQLGGFPARHRKKDCFPARKV